MKVKEKRNWLLPFVALVLVLSGIPGPVVGESLQPEDRYESRSPIRIYTDAEFTSTNGVVGGTGTKEDPYRISGWHIKPTGGDFRTRTGIAILSHVNSHFIIENNMIELTDNSTRGIFVGTHTGLVTNNVITSSGVLTYGILYSPAATRAQNPWEPIKIENNILTGSPGLWQRGIGIYGIAVDIRFNQFMGLEQAILLSSSRNPGLQPMQIHQNDFIDSNWGIASYLFHVNSINVAIHDARNNYWGDSDGPTTTICISITGCETALFGERGAQAPPYVLTTPYATEPFFPDG